MAFEIKEMTVKSTDNIHTLVGKIYIPSGEIKGLFHIVHGMTEHIERYDDLMSYLAENGYVAFGYDHLGHGKTARDDSELGFFASNSGWKILVRDVAAVSKVVKDMYPEYPLTLYGHSMGSFIARITAEYFPELYNKLIICGSGAKNPMAPAGLFLTSVIGSIMGKKHISKLVLQMAFGGYRKAFKNDGPHGWLTKDLKLIEKYQNDKFCTFSFTVSAMHDLIKLNSVCNSKQWFENINKQMPIFIISGDKDPVGDFGKGITKVYEKLKLSGANVSCKLYENCRHEIHNDTCREEVKADILAFIG